TPGTTGPSSHSFNLDSADFAVDNPAVPAPVKPPIRGVADRAAIPTATWQPVVNAVVLQARWADLQTANGGAIVANNVIDQELAVLRQLNAQKRDSEPHLVLKLRVRAGNDAPDWAKSLDGTPVSVHDTDGRTVI